MSGGDVGSLRQLSLETLRDRFMLSLLVASSQVIEKHAKTASPVAALVALEVFPRSVRVSARIGQPRGTGRWVSDPKTGDACDPTSGLFREDHDVLGRGLEIRTGKCPTCRLYVQVDLFLNRRKFGSWGGAKRETFFRVLSPLLRRL